MATSPISGDEKRQALERVLGSRAFARSDQLRAFLRFVCEAELAGRAQQLNEYALGVSVLGRPADYSPAEDSCVRSRAYELRNKLKTYYGTEAPDDPIEIQIDKGAYVPRFERRGRTETSAPPEAESSPPPAPAPDTTRASVTAPPARRARASFAALAIGAALAASGLALFLAARAPRPAATEVPALATPEMRALWQPFLDSNVPLLISFEIRLFFYAPPTGLVVRDYQTNQPSEVARSKPLRDFQERTGAEELRPTYDYADFGAVHAGFLLGRLLRRQVALKHSSSLGFQDLWNSNIVFIGKPNLNPTIRYALQGKDFVETEHGTGIRNLHPRPGEPELWTNAMTHGAGVKYALVTVLPGPQSGRRMLILSGAGAELMWALAESVTDPTRVRELMTPLLTPSGDAPPAFQVVVEATFEANVPVKIRFVSHRVTKDA